MKRYSIVLMVLLILTLSASWAAAAFLLPGHVYRIDQLQQAKEEAQADDKQIVFLYSDEHTTCSLATRASMRIIHRFRSSAVVVYICKEEWAKVPRIVRDALKSPEAGKYIPKTVVVDSNITEIVSIIPYEKAGK